MNEQQKKSNRRTGLVLAVLAVFFFVMVFAKRLWLG
jgi:hypothetical protein